MNKNPLIIHLGLPKTGTTTLQHDVFKSFDCLYLGVEQPRERPQNKLYSELMSFVCSSNEITDTQVDTLKNGLLAASKQKAVLISDEMFLVGERGVPWETKLRRLAILTAGLNVQLLLTLREPFEGLKSYFIELCTLHNEYRKLSLSEFAQKNDAQIFKYDFLESQIASYFPDASLNFLIFERMFHDDSIRELFARLEVAQNFEPKVTKRNNRRAVGDNGIYVFDTIQVWARKLNRKINRGLFQNQPLMRRWAQALVRMGKGSITVDISGYDSNDPRIQNILKTSSAFYLKQLY